MKWVLGTPGDLVIKSEVSTCCGSTVLRLLNPIPYSLIGARIFFVKGFGVIWYLILPHPWTHRLIVKFNINGIRNHKH